MLLQPLIKVALFRIDEVLCKVSPYLARARNAVRPQLLRVIRSQTFFHFVAGFHRICFSSNPSRIAGCEEVGAKVHLSAQHGRSNFDFLVRLMEDHPACRDSIPHVRRE